ncbi:MAG TPA: sigma factor-like helix-turn-helix DNA-binding protein [Streptosporangiaceae bacterium]|nr:sigma factor-like helix-turn-helix DNA-binding protein [Streptosporangiaceae bacterium]
MREEATPLPATGWATGTDDQLALIFTCCHPALDPAARVGLTLRCVCGLTTAEIAAALLVPEPTMAQRLVRAKRGHLAHARVVTAGRQESVGGGAAARGRVSP